MTDEELAAIRARWDEEGASIEVGSALECAFDDIAALADYPTVPMNRDSLVREVRALLAEVDRLRAVVAGLQLVLVAAADALEERGDGD